MLIVRRYLCGFVGFVVTIILPRIAMFDHPLYDLQHLKYSGGTLLSRAGALYYQNIPFLALKTDYLIKIRNRALHNANNS